MEVLISSRRLPFTIGTDKHAAYPEAFAASIKEKVLPSDSKLRRVRYLNNVIEQDHRATRRRWRAMQCFRSFHTAERAIEGLPAAICKDPAWGLGRRREAGERVAVESLGLPRRAVPRPILFADDEDGNDNAVTTQLVE